MPPCFLYASGVTVPRRVPAHFLPRAITTLLSGAILAPTLALAEETQRLSPIVVTAGGFDAPAPTGGKARSRWIPPSSRIPISATTPRLRAMPPGHW